MKLKRVLLIMFAIGGLLILLIFFVSAKKIGQGVGDACRLAQERYGGDCVESLIRFLDDEENSPRRRNSAVWALGQLGDAQALPVLEKYYRSDNGGQRERLDTQLSQYELKKAIRLAKGGLNLTAFLWRKKESN
jgi:hypothetical protein